MNIFWPKDDTAMEHLACFIIRASFSQERMQYLDREGKVIYMAKDGKKTKIFPALEWLAAMCSHIPNRGEQMVRYYGYYSNVSRGKRHKEGRAEAIPCILESQGDEKTFRRNWARLIQKIYEVDPLVCPKCQGAMRVISSIEDPSVIRVILDQVEDRPRTPGVMAGKGQAAARLPLPSRMTSRRSPFMTTTPMGTLNTPGTITSKHDAS